MGQDGHTRDSLECLSVFVLSNPFLAFMYVLSVILLLFSRSNVCGSSGSSPLNTLATATVRVREKEHENKEVGDLGEICPPLFLDLCSFVPRDGCTAYTVSPNTMDKHCLFYVMRFSVLWMNNGRWLRWLAFSPKTVSHIAAHVHRSMLTTMPTMARRTMQQII